MMRDTLAAALALACLSGAAPAQSAPAQSAPPPPFRTRYHVWKLPVYLVVGLPRDVVDVPPKALSSVPVLNRVLIAPLAIVNTVTAVTSWSFTRYGIDGGFEAWVACMRLQRAKGKPLPESLRGRRWWQNYFPNLRSFRFVTREERY